MVQIKTQHSKSHQNNSSAELHSSQDGRALNFSYNVTINSAFDLYNEMFIYAYGFSSSLFILWKNRHIELAFISPNQEMATYMYLFCA